MPRASYYERNKEKLIEYDRKRYKEYGSVKVECQCGMNVSRRYLKRHKQNSLHARCMKAMERSRERLEKEAKEKEEKNVSKKPLEITLKD